MRLVVAACAVVGAIGLVPLNSTRVAAAQELFAYPARGQGPEQQARDEADCHAWAVQRTGFDPSRPSPVVGGQPPSAYEAPQGGVGRGAARGALVGVLGGAIAGEAGRGAAIGAAAGGLLGGMRRQDQIRRQQHDAQAYHQRQAAAQEGATSAYGRALGACLTGRGYAIN